MCMHHVTTEFVYVRMAEVKPVRDMTGLGLLQVATGVVDHAHQCAS